ncbi:MAG: N-acetylmuramoyl-L-alanine amidase [Bacteroidetes Order II. Incertae sedis bacterium]|nr:N-acetylmuramoyl-L-alanine amidase [Bacteroidetes Order II. bacterium]
MKNLFRLMVLLCSSNLFAQDLHEITDHLISLSSPLQKTEATGSVISRHSNQVKQPFDLVMIQGLLSDARTQGEVRFFDGVSWSQPTPLRLFMTDDRGRFIATYQNPVPLRDVQIEVRFKSPENQPVFIEEAGVQWTAQMEERTLRFTEAEAATVMVTGRLKAPSVIRRTEWNARPFGETDPAGCPAPSPQPYYTYLTFHHTAGPKATTLAEGKARVKSIQDFHLDGNKWCDIGYQFLMDVSGRVYQGRPWVNESKKIGDGPQLVIGAHVSGGNTGNIGISLMGCFHPAEANCSDVIPAATLDSLVHYFSFMAETYKINPDNIRGHRDFNSTSCPGDNNYKLLSEIRTRVKDVLLTPNDREHPLPETSILEAIYPNPATSRTNIRFYLQETGQTDLTLYDAQGRRVARIANGIRFGKTWYQEPIILSGLPNGTYFLVLTTHSDKNEPTHKTQPLIVTR